MPVRSVLQVDVQDDSFRTFHQLFEKYRTAVDKLPGAWGKVGTATRSVKNDFADMASAMMAQAELLRKADKEMEHLSRHTNAAARGFTALAKDAKSIAGSLSAATLSLVKWTGIVGAVGGLAGLAGGLWGLDRLANSASGMRRGAMGLGVQPGAQQAFGLAFGRIVDPNAFLGSTQEALTDVTKRWSLYGAGLSENQLRGGNVTDVATQLLPAIRRIVQQTPTDQLAQVLQARGLNQFISVPDAMRLRGTSEEEFQSLMKRRIELEKEQRKVTVQQLRQWQEFNTTLHVAGQRIENAFIVGLGRMTPQLEKLSNAFSDAIKTFLESPEFGKWVKLAEDGLKSLSTWLTSGDARKAFHGFVQDVGDMATAVRSFVSWLKDPHIQITPGGKAGDAGPGTPGSPFPGEKGYPNQQWSWGKFWGNIGDALGSVGGALETIWPKTPEGRPKRLGDLGADVGRQLNPIPPAHAMETGGAHAMAAAGAVPPEARGLLTAIASRESEGAARRLGVSPYNVRYTPQGGAAFDDLSQHPRIYEHGPAGPSSAAGRYQFVYRTWMAFAKRLGLKDFSAKSQDLAAWADAKDVYKRATGRDLADDLRHHSFDPKAVPAFKREWASVRSDLPQLIERNADPAASTVANRHPDLPPNMIVPGAVRVEIHNQTGGSATVTGSQIAQ